MWNPAIVLPQTLTDSYSGHIIDANNACDGGEFPDEFVGGPEPKLVFDIIVEGYRFRDRGGQ